MVTARRFMVLVFCMALALQTPAVPDSTTSSSTESAYQELNEVVQHSREAGSYRLNVHFDIEVSDRPDPITIQSNGVFQSPYYRLMSETPSGMEVKSFGKDRQVLHIHPSTDEIVTSEKLGVSSVNRTLLDPFQHMAYLLDPAYDDVSVTRQEDERLDGQSLKVLRVEVGTEPVRDVMNKFRDQLKRPLKPGKTTAVYRILIDASGPYIRRIDLTVDSEFVERDETEEKEEWQQDLPEPEPEGGQQAQGPVQMHVEATFDLTDYGAVPDLKIPGDVKRMLDRMSN